MENLESWSPIVNTEQEVREIKDIIDKIYLNIINEIFSRRGFSLYFETGGLCLFLAHYQKTYSQRIPLVESSILYKSVSHILENSNSFKIEHISDLTKYAELGCLVSYLHKHELINIDVETVCSDLDDTLINAVPTLSDSMNLDLFGGVVSIGLYYYSRYHSNPSKFSIILSDIVDVIYSSALTIDGMVMWKSIIEVQSQRIGYNFGIAHGIPGIILFLRLVFTLGISKQKSRELIGGAVKFLLSQMHLTGDHNSLFYDVCDVKYIGEDSRLCWCYGDLGIAYSFILLSETEGLNCQNLGTIALDIFRHTLRRKTLKQAHVSDAGLCHGCFGIAHIYDRAFQRTKEPFLKEAAHYWYTEGIKFSNNTFAQYVGFELPYFSDTDEQESVKDYNLSFQTGIAGIALALIAYIEPETPDWDHFLLLS